MISSPVFLRLAAIFLSIDMENALLSFFPFISGGESGFLPDRLFFCYAFLSPHFCLISL